MHPERQLQQNNLRNLLHAGKRTQSPFYTLKASRKRARLLGNLLLKSYRKESIIGFRSIAVPSEIFYALDAIPLCVESVSAMLADAHLSSQILNISEEHYYSTDTCSFLRCTSGMAIENVLPSPDFLICSSYYCDGCPKLFQNLAKKYKKNCFILDIPYNYNTEEAVDYLAKQIEGMVKEIEKIIGRKMNPDKLAQTIRFSNEARKYFLKVSELRKNIPAPMLGGEAMDYAAMLTHTWGSRETVDVYKCLYEELKERVESHIGAVEEEQYRILWRHLRPYYNSNIIDYLENQCKAVIVFEEINYLHWEEMEESNPYRSMAKKLLSDPGIGRIEHWVDATMGLVEEYKINGVITFSQWGCRQLNGSILRFGDVFQKKNIPHLILDCDCIDLRDYAEGQIKTRIDGFLKLMETKKSLVTIRSAE